jgi:hypothetical protein
MGMAKDFGFVPTVYKEYSEKQVDSKYLFLIEIMVSSIKNKCILSPFFHQTLIQIDILIQSSR